MGVAFSLLSATCWAFSTTFTRRAQNKTQIDRLTGLFVTLVINNIINLIILAISLLLGTTYFYPRDGVIPFILGGILNSFIGRDIFFACIFYIGAARAGVVKSITPIFAILGGNLILGEKVSPLAGISVAIVLAGVFLVSIESVQQSKKMEEGNAQLGEKQPGMARLSKKGIVLGIVASAFLALGNIYRKAGMIVIPSPVLGVFVGSLAGLLACVAVLIVTGRGKEMITALRHLEINYVISGTAGSAALYSLFLALKFIPISIANSLTSTEPLFTLAIGYLLLRQSEKLTWKTVLGGFTVVIGVAILVFV